MPDPLALSTQADHPGEDTVRSHLLDLVVRCVVHRVHRPVQEVGMHEWYDPQ